MIRSETMADTHDHQAAFRQRRKAQGYRKLSVYLDPREAELLDRLKREHGTDKAAVAAALRLAAEIG